MSFIPFAKDLYLYTGSTFDGSIVIKDVHGEPFLISEGDEITFFIKKADKDSTEEPVQITITFEDEVSGEYPFKLTPEETANLKGEYYYSAFIRFADGDYYQIVPDTPLKAKTPFGVLSYYENNNRIFAQVPRVMKESDYCPALNELEAFIACVDSEDNERPIQIRHINNKAIVLIGNIDTNSTTPDELIERIERMADFIGAESPYVSGFFHVDEMPEQNSYYEAVRETYGDRFIDVETILKTPVYGKESEMVVSSVAFGLLKQEPSCTDILSIIHNEYPERIMNDNTHFNEKGCEAAARAIMKEVFNILGNFDNYYIDENGNVHRDIPLGTSPADAYVRTNMKLKKEVQQIDNTIQEIKEHIDAEIYRLDEAVVNAADVALRQLENAVNDINENVDELSASIDTRIHLLTSTVNSRVDNIITHNNDTEGNTELIDIRTGVDGTVYGSAGLAVRKQIENITQNYLHTEIVPSLDYGTININTGVITKSGSVHNRLVSDIIPKKSFSKLIITDDSFSVYVVYYRSSNEEDYVKSTGWITANQQTNVFELENYPFISFLVKQNDNETFSSNKNEFFYLKEKDIVDRQIEEIQSDLSQVQSNITDMGTSLDKKIIDTASSFSMENIQSKNYIDNADNSDSNLLLSANKRWFLKHCFIKNDIITELSFYNILSGTIGIELWEKENDTLTKKSTYLMTTTERKKYSVTINEVITKPTFIAITQSRSSIPFQSSNADYLLTSADISPDTDNILFSSLSESQNYIPSVNISYKTNSNTTIVIGKGMRYENIQDALEDITDDSVEKPYTLLVMPSQTPYQRFSMIRNLHERYPWSNVSPRYISIIGMNKHNCIIQSDTGEYDNPAAEIMTNGIIRNLTFKLTNDAPEEIAQKGGYAVHIDCRTLNDVGYKMTFENCDFISDTGPAVGTGSHPNTDLTFCGCRFESHALSNYAPNENYFNLTNYGCVFAHTSTLSQARNQKLAFIGCVGICKEGSKSLWVAKAGEYSSELSEYQLTLINNVFWNKSTNSSAYSISSDITLDPINYGNNISS